MLLAVAAADARAGNPPPYKVVGRILLSAAFGLSMGAMRERQLKALVPAHHPDLDPLGFSAALAPILSHRRREDEELLQRVGRDGEATAGRRRAELCNIYIYINSSIHHLRQGGTEARRHGLFGATCAYVGLFGPIWTNRALCWAYLGLFRASRAYLDLVRAHLGLFAVLWA